MSHVKWFVGVQNVIDTCEQNSAMWTGVAFRILGFPWGGSNHLQVVVGNFQTVTEPITENIRVVMTEPYIVEGNVSTHDFVSLMNSWGQGEDATVMDWTFSPPDVNYCNWDRQMPSDALWNPMLSEVDSIHNRYFCCCLAGSGDQRFDEIDRAILSSSSSMQIGRDEWMLEYLGIKLSPVTVQYLNVLIPFPVGVGGEYDADSNSCRVTIRYRRPFQLDDFWVRIGPGRWESNIELRRVTDENALSNGWFEACAVYDVSSDGEDSDVLNVWVGEGDTNSLFRWSTKVTLKPSDSPGDSRRNFLEFWYKFARQSVYEHVRQDPVGGQSKGEKKVQDQFEVLLGNVCGALGYAVLFGGRALSTSGVDFIAFDSSTSRAYLFSVTVSNDVRAKLRTLTLASKEIAVQLVGWEICPVIVCQVSRDCFLPGDIRDAQELNIPVLGQEDLEPLLAQPVDLEQFETALRKWF